MRAVWYETIGPASDVLVLGEMPDPIAGPGEVRVRLEASGVNPADVARRGGGYLAMEYPRVIPNSDGAGVVDQIGAGVSRFRIGDRVWLFNGQRNGRALGTAAEYIALAEHLVTPLPDALSFAEGATLGIPAMTAWCCLFGKGSIQDKNVLVTGGAGAVGHYAVQLAKWGGARVIATVSSEAKGGHARRGGADMVVNYKTEDVTARLRDATDGRGIDLAIDVDFGGNLATTLPAMALHGELVFYASNGDRMPVVPARDVMEKCLTVRALVLYAVEPRILASAQADLMAWIAAAPRMHPIASRFPLMETASAHRAVERGDKLGTVIVDCARRA